MHTKGKALSAREILAREYGTSRNMLTPHVITRGKLARDVAYELSSGQGIELGSSLYGVSVVRVLDDRTTERDYESSCCFSTLQRANEHVESLRSSFGSNPDGGMAPELGAAQLGTRCVPSALRETR